MKNLLVVFMLIVGGVILADQITEAQAIELVVSKSELEDAVKPQVPAAYEYIGVEIGEINDKSQGMAVVQQVSLQLKVKVKESLYRQTGSQNGKILLVPQAWKGDVVSIDAIAIVAKIMGHTKIQAVVPPARDAGVPLTNFQPNTYVIGEAESVVQAANQAKPSGVTPPATANKATALSASNNTPAAAPAADALQQLMNIANRNGGVWGVQGDRSYNNTPVILKNLVMESPGVLTGIIEHPYPIMANPFKLSGQAGQYTMQVITAPTPTEGIRSALYPMQVKDNKLTSRGGPEFPLRAEDSAAIEKNFGRTLRPWQYDGKLTDYAQVFGRLINIDTLEVASDPWISVLTGPVANLDVRYWSPNVYELTVPPYGAYGSRNIQTLELGMRKPIAPLRETTGDVWVSQDVGTYVRLRGGDLWKGTIDWQNNDVGEEVNLTQIGLLNKLQPIAWCGSNFYFHNFEATEKPILRINTDTGDFTELAEQKALNRNVKGSPDGRFLFASFGRFEYSANGAVSHLYVYNCRTGESFTMDAQIDERRYIGKEKVDPIPKIIDPRAWISESIFYTDIGWYDLAKRKRTLFIEVPAIAKAIPYEARAHKIIQIPGGDYLDLIMDGLDRPRTDEERNPPIVEKRYRVHRISGEVVELPLETSIHYKGHNNLNITWVDVNRYVVSRNKGGLSDVGTWLYDLRTGKHTRLTRFFHNGKTFAENAMFTSEANAQFMTPRYVTNQYLVLPQQNRIMFSTARGQVDELISVSLDGGESISSQMAVTKGANGKRLRLVYPYPVNLPLKINPPSAGASLQSAPSSPAVSPVAAAAQSSSINSLMAERQKIEDKCYASGSMRTAYLCGCYADVYMKNREKLGPDATEQSVEIAYRGECKNIPEFKRLQYMNCMSNKKTITNQQQQKIEQEPYCRCVSEKSGDLYAGKTGKESLDAKRTSILTAMAYCRKTGTYH